MKSCKLFIRIKLICFITVSLPIQVLLAQGESNVWYFGEGAGLDFNTSPPGLLENGNIGLISATGEGVGAISDPAGNLLFYTNGNIIYNKNHVAMTNGTGLNGNGTTTQTGIVIPKIGSTTEYYVLTPSDANNPVRYSVVDMSLSAGLGDVVVASKNTLLLANGSESAVVIPHNNGVDYWVVFHASTLNTYHVFGLTAAGFSAVTNYSVGGTGQATMTMKVNSCFDKISTAFYNQGRVEIVNFNNTTGAVTGLANTLSGIGAAPTNAFNTIEVYSSEFSPNGRYLYVSESGLNNRDDIHQFDISSGVNATIIASRKTFVGAQNRAGALQLGPDGKIYVPSYETTLPGYMSVIPNPNAPWAASPPTASEFEYRKYLFQTKKMGEGLPPVLKNLLTSLKINFNNACEGSSTNFSFISASTPAAAPSITWDFGDASPLVLDQYTPTHTYASAGTYLVTLTVIDICGVTRTGTASVIIKTGPVVTAPLSACAPSNVTFTGTGANNSNYTWSNSATGLPIIFTGTNYVYGPGPYPKTIYVQDPTPLATRVVGHTTAPDCFAPTNDFGYFEIFTTLTLNSFQVQCKASPSATNISIQNDIGTFTYWGPTAAPVAANALLTISPNVVLSPGRYRLFSSSSSGNSFCRNQLVSPDGNRDWLGVVNVQGEKNGVKGGQFLNLSFSMPEPCGIRAYTVAENCTAPVNLISFFGEEVESKTVLHWVTANEINNSYFLIQRSNNGVDFSTIGQVKGNENTASASTYYFIDETPLKTINYYRLAQVDFDGTITYSTVLVLQRDVITISVVPNPFSETVTILIPSTELIEIELLDLAGRVVETKIKQSYDQSVFVGKSLAQGTYIIRMVMQGQVYTTKINKE